MNRQALRPAADRPGVQRDDPVLLDGQHGEEESTIRDAARDCGLGRRQFGMPMAEGAQDIRTPILGRAPTGLRAFA